MTRFPLLLGAAAFSFVATSAMAQGADLSIDVHNSGLTYAQGIEDLYFIRVTNLGPDTATGVTLSSVIPSSLDFIRMDMSGSTPWACSTPTSPASGPINCSTPTMAAGQTSDFAVVIRVDPGVAEGTLIIASATVASETPDPDPANNSDSDINTAEGAPTAPAPVPTLTEWAMILFAALLAGGAARTLQRRSRAA